MFLLSLLQFMHWLYCEFSLHPLGSPRSGRLKKAPFKAHCWQKSPRSTTCTLIHYFSSFPNYLFLLLSRPLTQDRIPWSSVSALNSSILLLQGGSHSLKQELATANIQIKQLVEAIKSEREENQRLLAEMTQERDEETARHLLWLFCCFFHCNFFRFYDFSW